MCCPASPGNDRLQTPLVRAACVLDHFICSAVVAQSRRAGHHCSRVHLQSTLHLQCHQCVPGVRCALTMSTSNGMSNFFNISQAADIVGKSESDPIITPTSAIQCRRRGIGVRQAEAPGRKKGPQPTAWGIRHAGMTVAALLLARPVDRSKKAGISSSCTLLLLRSYRIEPPATTQRVIKYSPTGNSLSMYFFYGK
eukprot:COSAG01_NODE_1631_length_9673_cov_489.564550_6_plen_196_part_00